MFFALRIAGCAAALASFIAYLTACAPAAARQRAGAGGSAGREATGGAEARGGSTLGGSDGSADERSGGAGAGGTGSGGASGGTTTSGADAALGSADSAPRGRPVAWVVEPSFTGNENPAVPQAGVLRLETDVAAAIHVEIAGGDEQWTLDLPPATETRKPILGLKPATRYEVTVSVSAGENTLTAGPLAWSTPSLPSNFIPINLVASEPSRMEPGMTMFAVRDGWMMAQAPIVIVDAQGVVRWYFSDPDNLAQEDLVQVASGNLLFGRDFCNLREIDLLGNVVRAWHASQWPRTCATAAGSTAVEVVDFHHESRVLASGNLLTLSTETRQVEGFPSSEEDPEAPRRSALVMGSAIVEFTPAGEIVKRISLLDLLDPTRIGRDSLTQQWPAQHAPSGQRPYDWDHANAVFYDEQSDSYLVSLRHQDAIVKVSRAAETLTWILGSPANWVAPWKDRLLTPEGSVLWPFHQHAVKLNPLGLGLYDNGNYRAAALEPFDAGQPQYSRAVIYAVDEAAKTVREVWSYGPSSGADRVFSTGMGDADRLPETGNVLITHSERVLTSSAGADSTFAQLLEVTPDGTRVFELTTQGKDGSVYPVYRSERIADLRR